MNKDSFCLYMDWLKEDHPTQMVRRKDVLIVDCLFSTLGVKRVKKINFFFFSERTGEVKEKTCKIINADSLHEAMTFMKDHASGVIVFWNLNDYFLLKKMVHQKQGVFPAERRQVIHLSKEVAKIKNIAEEKLKLEQAVEYLNVACDKEEKKIRKVQRVLELLEKEEKLKEKFFYQTQETEKMTSTRTLLTFFSAEQKVLTHLLEWSHSFFIHYKAYIESTTHDTNLFSQTKLFLYLSFLEEELEKIKQSFLKHQENASPSITSYFQITSIPTVFSIQKIASHYHDYFLFSQQEESGILEIFDVQQRGLREQEKQIQQQLWVSYQELL